MRCRCEEALVFFNTCRYAIVVFPKPLLISDIGTLRNSFKIPPCRTNALRMPLETSPTHLGNYYLVFPKFVLGGAPAVEQMGQLVVMFSLALLADC